MGFDRFPRYRALGALLLPLLSGCEPTGYWDGIPAPQKLESAERTEEVALALTGAGAISEASMARLRLVIGQEETYGRVSLELRAPASADTALPGRLLGSLYGLGVPADRVRLVRSPAEGGVLVRVRAIRLIVPNCLGVPTDSLGDDTPLSMRRYQLGCASAVNFAAMLADPRDLTAAPAAVPESGAIAEQAIAAMNAKYGPAAAAQKKLETPSLNGGPSSSGGLGPAASVTSAPIP